MILLVDKFIILPPLFSPNVNSWYDYHSMRIEFVVRTYINEDQIDSLPALISSLCCDKVLSYTKRIFNK